MKVQDLLKQDLNSVTNSLLKALKADSLSKRYTEFEEPSAQDGGLIFAVRDFGNWEVPEDEDDDGDYDWEVPTESTYKKLEQHLDHFNKTYSQFKFTFSVGEKNWIYFHVSPK